MCAHCQFAAWLMEARHVLNRHGVDVASHAMWLMNNDGNVPRIEWPGHPEDGMWRKSIGDDGRIVESPIPIRMVTRGLTYTIDVDENVSPAQIILQYRADDSPDNGGDPYTLGVISISVHDLSVRYYRYRCGVAKEVSADGLPKPMNCQIVR